MFLLKNVKTDLDKLTSDDVTIFYDALADWTYGKEEKPVSSTIKKQCRIGFQRFLTHYTADLSEEVIQQRAKLTESLKMKVK